MDFNAIIALALADSHTKAGQVSSTNLASYFNICRNELGNLIIKDVDEDFFFQIWKRDAVVNQENGEYPYPEADSDSAGMLKCNNVYVERKSTGPYHLPAREVKLSQLNHDWSWYLDNQPKSDPIYFIADESIFIAPQFTADDLPASPSGNAQIKLTGIAKLTNLAAGATEAAVLIPTPERIAIGMKYWILKSRNLNAAAAAAKQEFDTAKLTMVSELTNRDNSEMCARTPDDTALQY